MDAPLASKPADADAEQIKHPEDHSSARMTELGKSDSKIVIPNYQVEPQPQPLPQTQTQAQNQAESQVEGQP